MTDRPETLDVLAARARAHSRRAFGELAERASPRIRRLAWRVLGDAELAADVLQDVLIKLLDALPGYDPARPFAPWLDRITVRAAIDLSRTEHRERRVDLDSVAEPGATPADRPDRRLDAQETRDALTRLTAGLPGMQRRVFVLRDLEEWTTAEIAAELGIAESTVRVHLARAREAVRRAWLALNTEGERA